MKLRRHVAAFAVDVAAVTAITTPLWWLVDQDRGLLGALISGAGTGVVLGVLWRFVYIETVWMRMAKRLRPRPPVG